MARILRVAFSALVPDERLVELRRLFGSVEVVETIDSPDPVRVFERAQALEAQAVVCDVGKRVAISLRQQFSTIPIVVPLRRMVEERREFREGVFPVTRETFAGYGLLHEDGHVGELKDRALR